MGDLHLRPMTNNFLEIEAQIENAKKQRVEISRQFSEAGNRCLDNGDVGSAKQAYQHAIEQDETNADALAGLGCCFISEENLEQAMEYFKKALVVVRNFKLAMDGLKFCAIKLGKDDDLKGPLEWYCGQSPNDKESELDLIFCYYRLGEFDLVKRAAKKIFARNPVGPRIDELRAIVGTLV